MFLFAVRKKVRPRLCEKLFLYLYLCFVKLQQRHVVRYLELCKSTTSKSNATNEKKELVCVGYIRRPS